MAASCTCCRRCPQLGPTAPVGGLRARGGYQIDMEWRDGLLQRAELTAIESGRICILQVADRYKIRTVTGAEIASTIEGHRLFFSAEAGQSYVVEPR